MSGGGGGRPGGGVAEQIKRDIDRLIKHHEQYHKPNKDLVTINLSKKRAKWLKRACLEILHDEVFTDPRSRQDLSATPAGKINGKGIQIMLSVCSEVVEALKAKGV